MAIDASKRRSRGGRMDNTKVQLRADNNRSRRKAEAVTKVAVDTYKKAMKELEKH